MFDLTTTLDKETQRQLDRKRQLTYKKERSEEEEEELIKLTKELEQLGFSQSTRDPLYEKFIEKLFSRPEYQNRELSKSEIFDMDFLISEILDEVLEEEKS